MKVSLTANVVVLGTNKDRNTKSLVSVKMGNLELAKATLGGRYTVQQAMAELRNQPQRFTLNHPESKVILESQGVKFPKPKLAALAA